MRVTPLLLPLAILPLLAACGRDTPSSEVATGFQVNVAPLALAGVEGATYRIEVFAGDPAEGAELVVDLSDITSGRYGDGKGSISYVAPCDASVPTNYVRLTLVELRDSADVIDPDTWQNPTPLVRPASCVENRDTLVEFNLTILRDASQGFFEVAVSFSDVFCSAKYDCRDANGDELTLLHNGQDRDTTMVLAFACTSGAGDVTYLHMSDLYVECANGTNMPTTFWVSPTPAVQPGNQGAVPPVFFQTAIYAGDESLEPYDKCYWNLALGLSEDAPANCVLKVDATASDTSWATRNGRSPNDTVYPYIHYEIPFTDGEGKLSCGRHAVNDASLRVSTRYTDFVGTAFPHERKCGDTPKTSSLCEATGQLAGVDTQATYNQTPSGVSVAFGAAKSRLYQLPADLKFQLRDCCLNPCCTTP